MSKVAKLLVLCQNSSSEHVTAVAQISAMMGVVTMHLPHIKHAHAICNKMVPYTDLATRYVLEKSQNGTQSFLKTWYHENAPYKMEGMYTKTRVRS